jgi:general secretion pathway protein E
MVDPLDSFTREAVAMALGRPVAIAVAVPVEFDAAFERLYAEADMPDAAAAPLDDPLSGSQPVEEDAERLRDLASEAPVIRLVNQMIARAVETHASDVHLEPFPDRLRVRYRYDGLLHEVEPPPAQLQAAVISRIKIMARLDIAERRLPQDGRIKLTVRGQDIDFRVSTVPALHGETVVLRVLDRTAVEFDYDRLGFAPDIRRTFERLLELPNGMVLVTGPTGSGKTTTLYTGLLRLNTVARKIVTVEDPIEYQLAGINQIQVKPQIGLNFANLLRSILRQDPDVIMIGEIRDLETAQIAVQAALTGHLVLSTLHTNSAVATVTRLRDMGVEDYLLTATLKAVLAQRLVRRLCPACKTPDPDPAAAIARFGLDRLAGSRPITLYRAAGCPACRGTGYRGRRAIGELLVPSPAIERLIYDRAEDAAVERAAVAGGMRPIFENGLAAVCEGDTTVEEVVRCVRSEG